MDDWPIMTCADCQWSACAKCLEACHDWRTVMSFCSNGHRLQPARSKESRCSTCCKRTLHKGFVLECFKYRYWLCESCGIRQSALDVIVTPTWNDVLRSEKVPIESTDIAI